MDAREAWDRRELDERAERMMRLVEAMSADEARVLAIKLRTDAEDMTPGRHRQMVEIIAKAVDRIADGKRRG